MKLRILDNSIRLRLTQTEVDEVAVGRSVGGILRLPDGSQLEYRLSCLGDTDALSASMDSGILEVQVATSEAVEWASSDDVSLRGEQPLEAGDTLRLLVEKDFHCLSPRDGEDESDLFPHPEADHKNC